MKELSTLTNLPSTKAQVKTYFQSAKQSILSGEYNPLMVKRQIKAFLSVLTQLDKDSDIRDAEMKEALKEGSKTFEKQGAKFTIKEAGTSYDYSVCKYKKWDDLDSKIKKLNEDKKILENVLKAHKEVWADPETGEIIYPPAKTSTTILTVELL